MYKLGTLKLIVKSESNVLTSNCLVIMQYYAKRKVATKINNDDDEILVKMMNTNVITNVNDTKAKTVSTGFGNCSQSLDISEGKVKYLPLNAIDGRNITKTILGGNNETIYFER